MEDREEQRDDRRDGGRRGRKASSLAIVFTATRLLAEMVIRIVIGMLASSDDHE